MSSMTSHYDLIVPYVRSEIRSLSQRYARDRMEEHPNIMTNLMISVKTLHEGLKRRLPQNLCN